MSINRRQFERLQMSEDALALDESGRELGRVSQAGGGGMMILTTPECADSFTIGQQFRVTILEPGSQTRNEIDVVVRYADATGIGLEFVTGSKSFST